GKQGDGFKIAMGILNQGRVGLAVACVGAMKSVYQDTIHYAAQRKTFGKPIHSYEIIQNFITEMAMNIYAAESISYFTTGLIDSNDNDYSIEAAICKVYCTELGWQTVNMGMQIHGGNGFMKDYGLELKLRDARIGLIFEGTNEILHLFIAMTGLKEIASQYQKVGKELQTMQSSNLFDAINLALSKIGLLSEFAIREVKKSVFSEKIEGFHYALEKECDRLSSAAKTLSKLSSQLIRKYGKKLIDEQMQMNRLAKIAINTYLIAAVLSRINSVLEKHGGVEKNRLELEIAKLIIRNAKTNINQFVYAIKRNKNKEIKEIAKKLTEENKYPFPISAVK
ncbi:MAG: hypothetical protein K2X39_10145, partial [Silvanigrellaceae bacterium]|nr:hypothetical protein [Silvanigrellaceae bacterium]